MNPKLTFDKDRSQFVTKYCKPKHSVIGIVIVLIVLLLLIAVVFLGCAYAWTDEEIVNAIYKAEGGAEATYAYGIRSVPYDSIEEARQICFNTVRNNRKRFIKQTKYTDYLEFLSSRYAPLNVANDPNGLNRHWLKNVRFFLRRAK